MQIRGSWKTKESLEKYKNSWIRVREDQVIRPSCVLILKTAEYLRKV